ncbi:hypothetical protein EEL35_08295 [Muribaculaceae bacterium Isolate-042 (Harlan)]|nr:hypothetical protein EEL35_08295 [Muribaculaceae bacterium Isolate-042 (Harlan)]
MNALAIHLYLTIRHINLSFNYFGNFYRIIVQGSRHYKNFTKSINDLMIEEVDFMSKIIGGHASQPIDLNQIYIENIGNIFVESISQKFI